MAAAVPLLVGVFGKTDDIGKIVKNFDFSKISVRDQKSNEYLHTDLAPSYGALNKESLQQLDDDLKVMIAGTMKILAKQTTKNWEAVLSTMMQNELLEADPSEVARSDKLVKTGVNYFKFSGAPDSTVVKEVQSWFVKLVSDSDVLQSTKIDIKVLADIVAQSGATINSFETFFVKSEVHEQTMVDIGVLRFPDIDNPFFKLYRIKLTAWSDSTRILFVQDDKNGITGEYNSRIFRPRKSIIDNLTASARQKALDAANSLFD